MDREPDDRSEPRRCAQCGASVLSESERAFEFGDENLLCWECATARGGRYDEAADAWEPTPDLGGLSDEAYGASPHEVRRSRR
jgi:hypothetical protein